MKPIDLVKKHMKEHKQTGNEIKVRLCPFCNGGRHNDLNSFSVNAETGAYNCKRGSCGEQGSFQSLLRHFGEGNKTYELRSQPRPSTTVVEKSYSQVSGKAEEYLKKRGFSRETWEKFGVQQTQDGILVFPYHKDGELMLVKYRKAEKYSGKGNKAWREPGGTPIFWGMDLCNEDDKQIVIVEGECDALALTEAGVRNVVSVPSGAEDLTCIDTCWDWLQQWEEICIWPDNDEPGQEMARKLINSLGAHRCYIVQTDHKDANIALHHEGAECVKELVRTAKPVPIAGLVRLADVESWEFQDSERVRSVLSPLNRIVGGYMLGMLSVWTGENSSGKSTYIGQEIIESIAQGYKCCVYSGELPLPIYRYWIDLQVAGPSDIEMVHDEVKQEDVPRVKKEAMDQIRDWYRNKWFCYDSMGGTGSDDLFEVFNYAAKRYGCKVFLVDNLMMMTHSDNDKDFWQKQGDFVKKLKKFAQLHDVHVHLVAHPRKTGKRLEKVDIMGSGNISNVADNIFSVYRVPEDDRTEEGCDAYIDVFKNRFSGTQEVSLALLFDSKSKRFYLRSDQQRLWHEYDWKVKDKIVLGGGIQ